MLTRHCSVKAFRPSTPEFRRGFPEICVRTDRRTTAYLKNHSTQNRSFPGGTLFPVTIFRLLLRISRRRRTRGHQVDHWEVSSSIQMRYVDTSSIIYFHLSPVAGLAQWQRRSSHQRSCSTPNPVSSGMGDRLLQWIYYLGMQLCTMECSVL